MLIGRATKSESFAKWSVLPGGVHTCVGGEGERGKRLSSLDGVCAMVTDLVRRREDKDERYVFTELNDFLAVQLVLLCILKRQRGVKMTVNRDIIWETVRVKFTVTRQRGVKLEMKDRELKLLSFTRL